MDKERRVVALVRPMMLTNRETGMHAARITELGLTAYGNTQDEAMKKVKRMYACDVYAHRDLGTLEDWLNRSGLNWFWEDQYKGAVPVENADTNPEAIGQTHIGQMASVRVRHDVASSWVDSYEPVAMAA